MVNDVAMVLSTNLLEDIFPALVHQACIQITIMHPQRVLERLCLGPCIINHVNLFVGVAKIRAHAVRERPKEHTAAVQRPDGLFR